MYYLTTVNIAMVRDQYYFYFYLGYCSERIDKTFHCILNYNDILKHIIIIIIIIFQIEVSSINFLTNFEYVPSLYFLSHFFEAFK